MKKIIILLTIFISIGFLTYLNVYCKDGSSCCENKIIKNSSTIKVYVCPMDEHKNIAYANENKCPLCKMDLIEKEVEAIYVCPMEEHQDKMYLKDGKCPECGMKLKQLKKLPEKTKKEQK